MFGIPANPPFPSVVAPPGSLVFFPLENTPLPDNQKQQVRGFGFLHDGSVDTVFRFLSGSVFLQRVSNPNLGIDPRTPANLLDSNHKDPGNAGGLALTPDGIAKRRELEAFLLAFDSNLAPIFGQQITLTKQNGDVAGPRVDLLMARADAHECDLVARNRFGGFLYVGTGKFRKVGHHVSSIPERFIRNAALFRDGETTYTCMPFGSDRRVGVDRHEDGVHDDNDSIKRH